MKGRIPGFLSVLACHVQRWEEGVWGWTSRGGSFSPFSCVNPAVTNFPSPQQQVHVPQMGITSCPFPVLQPPQSLALPSSLQASSHLHASAHSVPCAWSAWQTPPYPTMPDSDHCTQTWHIPALYPHCLTHPCGVALFRIHTHTHYLCFPST